MTNIYSSKILLNMSKTPISMFTILPYMIYSVLYFKISLPVMDLNMAYKTKVTSKHTRNSDLWKIAISRVQIWFPSISPVLARHTPSSRPCLLFYYTYFDHNNLNLRLPALHTNQTNLLISQFPPTMSFAFLPFLDNKTLSALALTSRTALTWVFKYKQTFIILHDDVWSHIVSFIDAETLPALACAGKTTRDAAVFRDVANGSFSLMLTTELHLVEFAKKDGYNVYFQDLFASPIRSEVCSHDKWEGWFAKLGDIGTLKGKVPTGVTAGVLRLLRYGSRAQLEALAKLAGKWEGFDDKALTLEARKRLKRVLEKAHKAGKVTEEAVLDGVLQLGDAHMRMKQRNECVACFRRAKDGFMRLLGEGSAKAVNAAFKVAGQIPSDDERIAEWRRLWEMAKVSLPEEAVTYEIAYSLGIKLKKKGKYEEAKVFYLAALEGLRRVLGDEHKTTLTTMYNMGVLLNDGLKDYEGAVDYYQQALRVQEKVLGKTHPDTLATIMNMAITYRNGLKDFVKAEEMYRQALDGYERSLGKEHQDTKYCARNLAIFYFQGAPSKEKLRELIKDYPHLLQDPQGGDLFKGFIR